MLAGSTKELDLSTIRERRSKAAYQDVKLCNCAGCGMELVAISDSNQNHHATYYGHRKAFGRLDTPGGLLGRPYCEPCYREAQRAGKRHARAN